MTIEERTAVMIQCVGEACTKTQACRILGRGWNTIQAMLEDGRLRYACGGERVDTRSIAEYIETPKQHDWEARKQKIKLRQQSSWAV